MRSIWSWSDGGNAFGVDRRAVAAVLDSPDLVPIPFAPSWLVGVGNRFGRAVAVVDCGQFAGLLDEQAPVRQVLVVPAAGAELGIAVPQVAVERVAGRGGDADGVFERLDDAEGTRLVVVERLVAAIAEWLGTPTGS